MKKIIGHLIRKEFIQLKRDPRLLPIVFIPPVIQLILLGYAANLDVKRLPLMVYDADKSSESRKVVELFSHNEYFNLIGYVEDLNDIDAEIDKGKVAMVLAVPSDFGEDLVSGRNTEVQLIVDGSESNSATAGLNYAVMILENHSRNILIERLIRQNKVSLIKRGISPEIRIRFNPELKSRNFMIPGILGLLLLLITMMLTSLAIVKEKEIGTIEQLIVSPIKSYELIIGKLTPFALIATIDIVLVLIVSYFVFAVPIRGNLFLLFALCFLFLLTTLGLGLFVSTISKNQQQAMVTAVFFVMMPMVFLSGFVFPIENMPTVIQVVTYLLPLRYFYTIIRGIFLKGVGIAALWDEALALLIFGLVILILSAVRFSKKLN